MAKTLRPWEWVRTARYSAGLSAGKREEIGEGRGGGRKAHICMGRNVAPYSSASQRRSPIMWSINLFPLIVE